MARRRIVVTLESRATYGYSKNVMLAMRAFPELELVTLVTGMHLVPELGNSVELIRGDGFPIDATVPMHAADKSRSAWSSALGHAIAGYAKVFENLKPDILLLSGDRIETFGCCAAAAYMGLPIAHIQAGDKSGHIDDAARYAIGKLAHIHLASCEDSANRLRRMGEQEFRIFNVGAPQLDNIVGRDYRADNVDINGRPLDVKGRYILLVQHPVLVESNEAAEQMEATIEACLGTGLPIYWIYPNSDQGYEDILSVLERYRRSEQIAVLENVEREAYLTLLANCAVLVGNSSSGILEAPSFKVPVVNIGNRQRGRPQAANIINCGYARSDIASAIQQTLTDQEFRVVCSRAVNPYGDGRSGERICRVMRDVTIDKKLLDKESTY
ncbi:MAG TPA: UDP-N-acetylglucosamine 2-epimerase [Candidatus Methylomirabilis sp.]|nr:UDP-N-acetylglucosamine 2-epimerase [Candidatus Methylomirabilis sp.]